MYTIKIYDGKTLVLTLTTSSRKNARAVKQLCDENGLGCEVVVVKERTVKFKGIS